MTTTQLLYLDDAYSRNVTAQVAAVAEPDDPSSAAQVASVALDQTIFYATGGGQPHDTGTITRTGDGAVFSVTDVTKRGDAVWHTVEAAGDVPPLAAGDAVACELDWERRHQLMRTHTMLHVLCGVVYNTWGKSVTGGNMTPLAARMDFEFDPLPEGFSDDIVRLVNEAIAADYPIRVSYLERADALADEDLIRTKVNLIPESIQRIRVVDIVGLDKQADGGTHVASTVEVGRFELLKTESKGKGNKRLRMAVHDA